jgi:hypothetical protein
MGCTLLLSGPVVSILAQYLESPISTTAPIQNLKAMKKSGSTMKTNHLNTVDNIQHIILFYGKC